MNFTNQIRDSLETAQCNDDMGDGDLGRGITAGDLDIISLALDYLEPLLGLVDHQEEYIAFLTGEMDAAAGFLHAHGWYASPTVIAKGEELRGLIAEATARLG